jgi:hypothetical protein
VVDVDEAGAHAVVKEITANGGKAKGIVVYRKGQKGSRLRRRWLCRRKRPTVKPKVSCRTFAPNDIAFVLCPHRPR